MCFNKRKYSSSTIVNDPAPKGHNKLKKLIIMATMAAVVFGLKAVQRTGNIGDEGLGQFRRNYGRE
jgi:hypothetical protein